jgi:hypothetical protein
MATTSSPIGQAGTRDNATPDRRRWLILGTVALAQLMVVLDATIVNIALPSAQQDLGFTTVDRQWVVTAYALAFGSLLLFGGRLGDLIGRKITFLAGALGFAPRRPSAGRPPASACWSRPGPRKARSARSSRPRRCRSCPRRSATRRIAARRSASTARSSAPAGRSAWCSAAS